MPRAPNPIPDTGLGALLRRAREEAGLSLRRGAEACGISPSYLSRIENGEVPVPPRHTLEQIADNLGMDPDELLQAAGVPPEGVLAAFAETPRTFVLLARLQPEVRERIADLLERYVDAGGLKTGTRRRRRTRASAGRSSDDAARRTSDLVRRLKKIVG